MWDDYFKLALEGIRNRKLRTGLTMLGVFIGIMSVVTLISLGQGLQQYIDLEFSKVGGDRISVTPGGGGFSSGAPGGSLSSAVLDKSDLDVVKKVKGVQIALGLILSTKSVEYNKQSKLLSIYGVPTDSEYLQFLKDSGTQDVDKGTVLRKGDKFKALVGPTIGSDNFNKNITVGSKIFINNTEFDVVGVLKDSGNPVQNGRIIIPLDTAQVLFNTTNYAQITLKVQKGFVPSDVAISITEKLRQKRDVKKNEEDFSVLTAESIVAAFKTVFNIVTLVLSGIAGISLFVGGVGIMTTMYTSVIERTRQIGVMKSIGARNSDILMIFMMESGILGIVGGIIGLFLGFSLSIIGEYLVRKIGGIPEYSLYAGPDLIFGALLFSIIIGLASGYFPAIRAAKMKPVDALRYR